MEENKGKYWNFFTCKWCSYRSKSFFSLWQHENLHEARVKTDVFTCLSRRPESYPCEFCEFQTNLKVDLTGHLRVFHEGKEERKEVKDVLKCYHCKNFETHSVIVLTHHTVNCNSLEQDERLVKRVQTKVSANVIVLIEHSYSKGLKEHVELEHGLQCEKSSLTQHIANEHADPKESDQGELNVTLFPSDFKQIGGLLEEIRTKNGHVEINRKMNVLLEHSYSRRFNRHLTESEQFRYNYNYWIKCGKCDLKCKDHLDIKQHFKTMHKNSAITNVSYHCEQCEYGCKRESNLKKHFVKKHPNSIIKWFQCTQCEYKSKYKSNFKTHVLRQHGVINWFQCEQCDYKCKRKDILKLHILRKHAESDDIPNLISLWKSKWKLKTSKTTH